MTAPIRIQLSRAKGWKMPPNTVKVDRTTRWGNPHTVASIRAAWPTGAGMSQNLMAGVAVLRFICETAPLMDLAPLRGKNLACWCKPGAPCHADALLKLANA